MMDKAEFRILVMMAIKMSIRLYGNPVNSGAIADYLYKRLFEDEIQKDQESSADD